MSLFSEDPEDYSRHEHLPSDYEIEEISSDPESLAYGLYSILTTYKDHFHRLQNKLKGLTVTWVIATYIGIGYTISGYEAALDPNVYLVILFLSALAAQGVFLLWFLDVGVYDKLIKSVWLEVYKLEEKYPIVGKSHHLMAYFLSVEKEPVKFHGLFYIYFIVSFIFIAFIALSVYFYYINPFLTLLILPISILITFLLYIAFKETVYKYKSYYLFFNFFFLGKRQKAKYC